MQLPATPRFIHALGLNGVFVTGWCKRGPKGDIGSNLSDAAETAASVMQWHQAQQQQQKAGFAGLRAHLLQRSVQWVPKEGWNRIDAEERRLGALQGRPRVKTASVADMLRLAGQ
jgi:ferredoxin--NADP+ reductase